MNNETNSFTSTIINIVDSRPVYIGIGLILITYALKTGMVQKLTDKLWNKKTD